MIYAATYDTWTKHTDLISLYYNYYSGHYNQTSCPAISVELN